jgi:hypothetical protein
MTDVFKRHSCLLRHLIFEHIATLQALTRIFILNRLLVCSSCAKPAACRKWRGRCNCAQLSSWLTPTLLVERQSGRVAPLTQKK